MKIPQPTTLRVRITRPMPLKRPHSAGVRAPRTVRRRLTLLLLIWLHPPGDREDVESSCGGPVGLPARTALRPRTGVVGTAAQATGLIPQPRASPLRDSAGISPASLGCLPPGARGPGNVETTEAAGRRQGWLDDQVIGCPRRSAFCPP